MSLTARTWRAALRQSSRRNFSSSTVSQRHTLPTFEPSSTPELDEVLDLARRRVLVPAHLNTAQEALVYREQHKQRLSAEAPEPYWSTVAGVDVTLEHIDRQRDMPARWRVFSDAVRLAQTSADWENVGRLIEGLADAGVPMTDEWTQKLVREAAARNGLWMVLRALERADRSGVRLRSKDVVERVLWSVRGVAADNGWGRKETERAVKWAEQVLGLMEREEHCGGNKKRVPTVGDPRTLPFVIATPLELGATLALQYKEVAEGRAEADAVEEGEDVAAVAAKYAAKAAAMEALVKAYAERLCINLKNFGTQESEPKEESVAEVKELTRYQKFAVAAHKLRRLVPVWHGLSLSQRVLGESQMPLSKTDTYRQLQKLREEIDAVVEDMRTHLRADQSVDNHADYRAWVAVRDQ